MNCCALINKNPCILCGVGSAIGLSLSLLISLVALGILLKSSPDLTALPGTEKYFTLLKVGTISFVGFGFLTLFITNLGAEGYTTTSSEPHRFQPYNSVITLNSMVVQGK